jgi:pimeloyl-ACP methyl ester carboxylesterase
MADVADRRMRGLPTTLMLRDKYDNIAALREFAGPLVVIVAEKDEVVGPDQGRLVHATYPGPKHLIVLPETHHADFPKDPEAGWWKELSNALLSSR